MLLEDSFNVRHEGKTCRVVDISQTGLGITYIGPDDWPEYMTLEYSLGQGSEKARLVKCRTVWESTMDFYKTRALEIVRRRGLEFMEKESRDVDDLHRHLRSMAERYQ